MPYVFNPFTGSFDDTVPLSGGKIPANYLPSYVDDIVEVANLAALPVTGEAGKIYITLDDNNTYRWSGSQYVLVGPEPPVVSVNGETGAVTLDLDSLSDIDTEAEHTAPFTDGRALIYVNGKWQAGPVIGGYSYSTGNDPLAASVVYGNSFNVNFLDESGYWNQVSKTLIVTQNGSTPPVISTADKKYGTGSYFANANGAYTQFTSTNDSAALSFGTGDFCIEGWFKDIQGFSARGLFYIAANANLDLIMNASNFLTVSSINLNSNTVWPGGWVHVALTRQNGLFRLFQNGVLVGSVTPTARNFTGNFTFRLGYANPLSPYYWYGYIDDLRITKGAARYTANFTPPTGAILGEQVISKYSLNNLDDVDTTTSVPANGQVLTWDSAIQQWKPLATPKTIASQGDYNLRLQPNATSGRWNTQVFGGLPGTGQFRVISTNRVWVAYSDSLGNNLTNTFNSVFANSSAVVTVWLSSDGVNWSQRSAQYNTLDSNFAFLDLQILSAFTFGSTVYLSTSDPSAGPATIALANRNVLAYNSATQKWEPTPVNADFLSDVDTTTATPTNGQALAWNGSNFVPTTVVRPTDSINVLADVDTATAAPTNGQALAWNGTNWVPRTAVLSTTTGITGASAVTNCISLSQANYDAIAVKDPNTLYVIV